MITMNSRSDNMHKSGIFYAFIFINKDVITRLNFMLLALPLDLLLDEINNRDEIRRDESLWLSRDY